jgi:hypothetical protein
MTNRIFVIILVILMVWWPIGGLINRRRGQAWLAWLQAGLKELGATSTIKWLRSFQSVGQLTVKDLRSPFRSFDVLFTLESRDNIILWVLRHMRGRRDEMIIQANLLANPVQELEVGYRGRRSYDVYLAKQKDNPFSQLPEQDGFRIAKRGGEDQGSIARLRMFLANQGQVIQRMSLQRSELQENQRSLFPRESKNLLLRADMTRMDAQSPAAFFSALRQWAGSVAVESDEGVDGSPKNT